MRRFTANLSLLFTELDFIDRFKAAKDCGFSAVEIQFPYSYPVEIIAQALQENDLQLVLFNVSAGDLLQGGEGLAAVPEKQTQFRDAIAETIIYAQRLKPEIVNVLPGRVSDLERKQAYLATFKENLHFAVNEFSRLGVETVFEAINTYDMPGFLIHSSQQMLDIIEQIDHPDLFMQYDVYHMVMMAENPVSFIHRYAGKIGHIQIADVPGRGQPGTGKIDFNGLFQAIVESGYRGWIGAEYKPTGATAKTLEWFQQEKSGQR